MEARGHFVMPLGRRVAAALVRAAERFQSEVLFTTGEVYIDAKSTLMALIFLNALKGQTVEVRARGRDSDVAVADTSIRTRAMLLAVCTVARAVPAASVSATMTTFG